MPNGYAIPRSISAIRTRIAAHLPDQKLIGFSAEIAIWSEYQKGNKWGEQREDVAVNI
jgi:hypothetical protein